MQTRNNSVFGHCPAVFLSLPANFEILVLASSDISGLIFTAMSSRKSADIAFSPDDSVL